MIFDGLRFIARFFVRFVLRLDGLSHHRGLT